MAVNGVYILLGELNAVVAMLRRGSGAKSAGMLISDEQDPLLRSFADLRDVLNSVNDLADMTPSSFLSPFLDVIHSEQTSGPVTGQALSAISKFLSYGLLDPDSMTASSAVQQIADAVTHARFVGNDPGSDEVVLLRILQVLRALLLTPVGALLTDEAVCEILQSCFRICFETRLSQLLRKAAESSITDMTQLLFIRLPTFVEDPRHPYIRRLKMRAVYKGSQASSAKVSKKKKAPTKPKDETVDPEAEGPRETETDENKLTESLVDEGLSMTVLPASETLPETTDEPLKTPTVVAVQGHFGFESPTEEAGMSREPSASDLPTAARSEEQASETVEDPAATTQQPTKAPKKRTNERGVRFTTISDADDELKALGPRSPYGLPSVRELLRFLVTLINPLEQQNTEQMLELGLNLLIVALEAGADHLGNYSLLLPLIQNELCRALVSLLSSQQRLPVFAGATRVGFLVFEALRTHLKLQFESYLSKLMEMVLAADLIANTHQQTQSSATAANARLELKEVALEALVQLWRIPGLVTELYLNYDCDLYCANLFEELTKLLSKNAFPVTGLTSAHLLSLDGLLTVVDTIETNCHFRMLNYKEHQQQKQKNEMESEEKQQPGVGSYKIKSPSHLLPAASGYSAGRSIPSTSSVSTSPSSNMSAVSAEVAEVLRLPQVRPNRMPITSMSITSHEDLIAKKQKKRLMATGAELFNQHPSKGVQFLQEHGLLRTPLSYDEAATWLKENPRLDKRKIAEYIVNRKNTKILEAFVRSFDFKNVRIDDALRMFLETFRLPGEAAEISMTIEHFADHWHQSNNNPFASVDAGFTLAYAVIMLNVDQHNQVARRQQQPMTPEDFKKNLNGVNGGENFDPEMLEEIYHAIKSDEIVMPAEHTGVIKENYLWKCLLKRAMTDGRFIHAPSGLYDHDLFTLVWGPTVAAVSFVFDKSQDELIIGKAIGGFRKCAAIAAHYGMSDVFDNLIINLSKFSTISSTASIDNPDQLGISLGENTKAQLATKAMFQLVHNHGDILREGWKNMLECLGHLFRSYLLPSALIEVEDYLDPKGWVSMLKDSQKLNGRKPPKSESGIFSSLYSWVGGGADAKEHIGPSAEELELIKQAKQMINDCHAEQLISDSKYLTSEALSEFLKALIVASVMSTSDGQRRGGALSLSDEQTAVFYLELIISVAIENRDRLTPFWRTLRAHLFGLLSDFVESRFLIERAAVGLVRLAGRLLVRDELADEVLQSLSMLRTLKYSTISALSRQISYGTHELLRSNAANIHKSSQWTILFDLLEIFGAAACAYLEERSEGVQGQIVTPGGVTVDSQSDTEEGSLKEDVSDRGYTSDTEVYEKKGEAESQQTSLLRTSSGNEWTYVEKHDNVSADGKPVGGELRPASLVLRSRLRCHDPRAYTKSCETLALLVRDAAHITPENFDACVRCLRTFIEAGLNGGRHYGAAENEESGRDDKQSASKKRKPRYQQKTDVGHRHGNVRSSSTDPSSGDDKDSADDGAQLAANYTQLALQLLDLTHALHVKAGTIYRSWAAVNPQTIDASSAFLWMHCWKPLLQALARLCCDVRKQVRTAALTYLQRALLMQDLIELSFYDWEDCFQQVLFPLLNALIEESSDAGVRHLSYDEVRVRASTLVSKVYLQHLSPLSASPSFTALWLRLLDFMESYLQLNSGDLNESIPESVKNMLLVMETTNLFKTIPGLAIATKEGLAKFLPELAGGISDYNDESCDTLSAQAAPPAPTGNNVEATTESHTATTSPIPPAELEEVVVVQQHTSFQRPEKAVSPPHFARTTTGRASSLTRLGGSNTPTREPMSSLIQQLTPAAHVVLHPPTGTQTYQPMTAPGIPPTAAALGQEPAPVMGLPSYFSTPQPGLAGIDPALISQSFPGHWYAQVPTVAQQTHEMAHVSSTPAVSAFYSPYAMQTDPIQSQPITADYCDQQQCNPNEEHRLDGIQSPPTS